MYDRNYVAKRGTMYTGCVYNQITLFILDMKVLLEKLAIVSLLSLSPSLTLTWGGGNKG